MSEHLKNREQWLKERKTGLGATDVATIIGAIIPEMKAFKTPLDVYMSKKGMAEPVKDSEALYWGRVLEPLIIERYEKDTGYVVSQTGQTIFRHPEFEHHSCSPDGLIINSNPERGLEVKTAGRFGNLSDWGPDDSDEIPLPYLVQIMWCMHVTGRKYWDVAALITGNDYRVYHFEADPEMIQMLVEEADRFWNNHVLADIPPPPINTDERIQFLRRLHPVSDEKLIPAEQDHLDLAYEYAGILIEEGERKKRKEEIKADLIEAIGGHDGLLTPDGKKITYKFGKPKKVTDWKACILDLGGNQDNITRHTTESDPTRTFRCGVKL